VADLRDLRTGVERILREAGSIATTIRQEIEPTLKKDGSLVTEADRAVESYLRRELAKLLPESTVWGEEEGFQEPGSAGIWLADPIDGTSNYAYGSPLWGITVALLHKGVMQVGGVALPDFDEVYSFHAGGGATCNGEPLDAIPPGPILNQELVSYCDLMFAELGPENLPGKMRYTGAFVIEGMWVARQRFRGLISYKANLYDCAACIGICAELGADIRYVDGSRMDFDACIADRNIRNPFVIFPKDSGWEHAWPRFPEADPH